ESRRGARGAVSPSRRIPVGVGGRDRTSPATPRVVCPHSAVTSRERERARGERGESRRGARGGVGPPRGVPGGGGGRDRTSPARPRVVCPHSAVTSRERGEPAMSAANHVGELEGW